MMLSAATGFVLGLSWGPYFRGDRIKQAYRMRHYREYDYEPRACSFLEENSKSIFSQADDTDYFLHVFDLDKFKEERLNYAYANKDSLIFSFVIPTIETHTAGVLAYSYIPNSEDSLYMSIQNISGTDFNKYAVSATSIHKNGRALYEIIPNKYATGDTLRISIAYSGNSINVPLYEAYPGSPVPINGVEPDRSISFELNPPDKLAGYYRHLANRARLKNYVKEIMLVGRHKKRNLINE